MSVGWDSLPLLPLRCVLDHLSLEDAVTAMSVCHQWRNAMLVYEGKKELLKLQANHPERNLFLARLYRKHVRRLHIYLDCAGEELDKFFNIVLPEFYDSVKLQEILFIGPSYLEQNNNLSAAKLKRIITESLVFKNSHCLAKFAMLGCEMDVANDNDRYMHEQIEYYSAPLSWSNLPSPADSILSSSNSSVMVFSTLQHISVDYDQLNTECLQTLSRLPMFSSLSLSVTNKPQPLLPVDWARLAPCYPNGVDVSVNVIAFPARRFNELMENVLVEGLALVSLKVFFCKTLHSPLITHVVRYHKATLRELVWVDSPRHAHVHARTQRVITHRPHTQIDSCNINPFILLCWQCVNLRRLVVHGYWIWQYDVLGFARLRKTLQQLDISAIYDKQRRYVGDAQVSPDSAIRVYSGDGQCRLDPAFIQEVNTFTEFSWAPAQWARLHPALSPRAAPRHRAHYILQEIAHTMDTM